MRQLIKTFITALVLVVCFSAHSHAASTLAFRSVTVQTKRGAAARVYAGDTPVMTISGRGWKSVDAGRLVAQRLSAFAEEGLRADEISIWSERKTSAIVARGERIVTIDKVIAASQGQDRAGLARVWAKNLRAQFGRPYLSASPLLVPVGELRSLPVKGNVSGQLVARPAQPIVTAACDQSAREVKVTGVDSGRTEIILQDGVNALRVPVRSARYAARLVDSVPAAVTGNPASRDAVVHAIRAAVGAGMTIEADAWTEISPQVGDVGAVGPGKMVTVPTQIAAGGPGYLSYHLTQSVPVRNEPMVPVPTKLLMVSNSPERILGHGLWFEGKMADYDAIRLLYHHVNGLKAPADLVVEVWNLGKEAARVQVVAGAAGPSYDESWVGHRAASQFLTNRAANSGWIIPVPAETTAPILSERMLPGSVASGVMELRLLGKGDLSVRLYLEPPVSQRTPRDIASYAPSPLLGHWHYLQTLREVKAKYEVGRDWTFITIGDQPAAGVKDGDQLMGSYGVVYEIDLELSNPTAETARVMIALEPAGGPARGALLVDGHPVETALLRRDAEGVVARYSLAPGQVRKVHIETMPQGGSNYPVRLVARPV